LVPFLVDLFVRVVVVTFLTTSWQGSSESLSGLALKPSEHGLGCVIESYDIDIKFNSQRFAFGESCGN
jgi:hypothetical protein